jgi:hypothetical protein
VFKLDNDFLVTLGLGTLPVDEKNKLLQAIYERLEMNVGMRLAEKMTDSQLDEFESFIDSNDEAGALRWLETNFPNYKDVVAEELEKLKSEVGAAAPQILAAAQAPVQPAQSQQPPQFQQPQPQQYPVQPNQPQEASVPPEQSMPPAYQPQPGFEPAQPQPQQFTPPPPGFTPGQ